MNDFIVIKNIFSSTFYEGEGEGEELLGSSCNDLLEISVFNCYNFDDIKDWVSLMTVIKTKGLFSFI